MSRGNSLRNLLASFDVYSPEVSVVLANNIFHKKKAPQNKGFHNVNRSMHCVGKGRSGDRDRLKRPYPWSLSPFLPFDVRNQLPRRCLITLLIDISVIDELHFSVYQHFTNVYRFHCWEHHAKYASASPSSSSHSPWWTTVCMESTTWGDSALTSRFLCLRFVPRNWFEFCVVCSRAATDRLLSTNGTVAFKCPYLRFSF